jgi:RHS repeat-associated protein
VKFLLDSANTGIEKYTYDAFGAPKITDWAGNVRTDSAYGNRFMFTGREYLSTIGIYDYRNRMYSSLLGRFLQTDPIGFAAGDNNLYRYVGNNPVKGVDPCGLFQLTLGGGYDGLGGYITLGFNGRQWNWGGYAGAGAGLFVNINPHDSGSHISGSNAGFLATAGLSVGPIGVDLTGYGGGPDNYATLEGNFFAVTRGIQYDGNEFSPTQGSITLGEGTVAGVGASCYTMSDSPGFFDTLGQTIQHFFGSIFGDDSNSDVTSTIPRSGGVSSGGSGGANFGNAFTGSVVGYGANGPTAGSITGSLLGDLIANSPSRQNETDH